MNSAVMVSGIKPTGRVHLGNYLGMIRPVLERARSAEQAFVFVADGHAMTTENDSSRLRRQTLEMAATLIALGLDPDRAALYRQSDVPEVFELAWILACATPKGLLNRAHAYKAAVDANERAGRPADHGVSAGLFTYPVLMAADILAVDGGSVPVGSDQAQHLDITRDIALAFNRDYGHVLCVPQAVVDSNVAVVPGTDGRKMSKSYDNVIPVLGSAAEIERLVRSVKTDSRHPDEPKDPNACNLFALYGPLVGSEEAEAMAARYRRGGLSYGEMKQILTTALTAEFKAARDRYDELMSRPEELERALYDGGRRARAKASEVLARVRAARGTGAVEPAAISAPA